MIIVCDHIECTKMVDGVCNSSRIHIGKHRKCLSFSKNMRHVDKTQSISEKLDITEMD